MITQPACCRLRPDAASRRFQAGGGRHCCLAGVGGTGGASTKSSFPPRAPRRGRGRASSRRRPPLRRESASWRGAESASRAAARQLGMARQGLHIGRYRLQPPRLILFPRVALGSSAGPAGSPALPLEPRPAAAPQIHSVARRNAVRRGKLVQGGGRIQRHVVRHNLVERCEVAHQSSSPPARKVRGRGAERNVSCRVIRRVQVAAKPEPAGV